MSYANFVFWGATKTITQSCKFQRKDPLWLIKSRLKQTHSSMALSYGSFHYSLGLGVCVCACLSVWGWGRKGGLITFVEKARPTNKSVQRALSYVFN